MAGVEQNVRFRCFGISKSIESSSRRSGDLDLGGIASEIHAVKTSVCIFVLAWRAEISSLHFTRRRLDQNISVFRPATRTAYVRLAEAIDVAIGKPAGISRIGTHIGTWFDHPKRQAGTGKYV